ncbi:DNA repair protein RadC [candidate division KSB1 bacterium]|nr:DNA repair protein RadC [candidate division KSB1 bacterium]
MKKNLENKKYPLSIREWPEDDRPREKLLKYGEHGLSNAELLAIIIRTGTTGKSAIDLGRELLNKFKSLRAMSGVDVSEFKEINGLKDAKISQLKAAIELGRRMMSEEKAFQGVVKSSADLVEFLMPLMRDLKKEHFKILLLDKGNHVSEVIDIDVGTVDRVNPSVRDILMTALKYQSPSMILAHNHPSGNINPSDADKRLTKDLVKAALAMELRIFDHVIIGDNSYFSFADDGLIEDYEIDATK